ncbi:MAG: hypothetical protein GXO43_08150 [Crenarchaeota archaeon]|nr:hypothetical protein [Thermoproteota archaeon]
MSREKSIKIIVYRRDEVDGELLENVIRAVRGEAKFYRFKDGKLEEVR